MWAIKNDGTAQYMVYDDLITSPLFTDVVDAAYDYILKSDGVLYRVLSDQWDDDGNRLQRADGTALSLHENLKLIKKLDNVVSIACAGDYLFTAVRADGTLWYWNELRDADPNDPECAARKVMDNVKAVYSSLEIDGFQNYMGILKNDGSLWMWGRNDYGKLGDGTYNYRYTPEEAVKVLDNVVSVQLVVNTSTALTADGTVWEWGRFSEMTPTKVTDGVKLPPVTPPPAPIDIASSWAKPGITEALTKGFIPSDLQNNYTNVITRQEFCRMAISWLEYATGKSIDTILAEKGLSHNTAWLPCSAMPNALLSQRCSSRA